MWRKVASGYPRNGMNVKAWKVMVSGAVAGIWNSLPDDAKRGVIRIRGTAKNPTLQKLACPKCGAMNPVPGERVYLRCRKCRLPLISVKVKRR